MELTPSEFLCADHGTVLTALVRDELEDQVPASFRRDETFRVLVTCPGTPVSGTHRVGFTGTVKIPPVSR